MTENDERNDGRTDEGPDGGNAPGVASQGVASHALSALSAVSSLPNETLPPRKTTPRISITEVVHGLSWALDRVFSTTSSSRQKERQLIQMRPLDVDAEILRGVNFHRILQQPRLFLSPSRFRHTPLGAEVWNRSRKVDGFDIFISHTWRTKGRWKVLSLLMQSGWLHGLLGWLCGVAIILCLEWLDIVQPFTMGSTIIAGVEYSIPLTPWGIIAGWFGMILSFCSSPFLPLKKQTCFLDMTSIHQSDQELLERGIYSIGGCLSVSKEFHLLYTPPYFGSLWCLFEIVAFRNSNPTGKIKFLPLFLERAVAAGACLVFLLSLVQWAMASLVDAEFRSKNFHLLPCLVIPPLIPMVHSTRRKYGDKKQLMDDLKSFELDKVSCASDFDAAFIRRAIEEWYGSKEAFTEFVRGPLLQELQDLLPSPHLPWTYVAFMLSSMVSFRLEYGLALARAGATPQTLAIYFLSATAYVFGWLFPSFNALFYLCDKTCESSTSLWLHWVKTLGVTLAVMICNVVGEGLSVVVLRVQNLWLGIGFLAASLLLPFYIWGCRRRPI